MRDERSRQRSTEVITDDKVIPLAGGDSTHLCQAAAHIDDKIAEFRQNRAYAHQSSERRTQILQLNLTDDYLQTRAENAEFKGEAAAHAPEVYVLERELVEQHPRMRTLQKDAKDETAEVSPATKRQKLEEQFVAAEKEKESLQAEKGRLTTNIHRPEEKLEVEKKRSKELETELDELLPK